MIPLPELAVEVILGLGAALFAGNLWALLRPKFVRPQKGRRVPRPPSTTRVIVNIVAGAVIALWAAATLIAKA